MITEVSEALQKSVVIKTQSLTRSPSNWINRTSNTNTQKNRRKLLATWARLNDASSADELLAKIRTGEADPYETANTMVERMLKDGNKGKPFARSTIYFARIYLPTFLSFAKVEIDTTEYDQAVTKVPMIIETHSKTPTTEQIRKLLFAANSKVKALVIVQLSTGARMGEIVQLELSDLNWTADPSRVHFRAEITKTYGERICFLTTEAKEILQDYLKHRPEQDSKWLFPGHTREGIRGKIVKNTDEHLNAQSAENQIGRLFDRIGLDERTAKTDRRAYHPHTFRTLHQSIAKTAGLPDSHVEAMVGHGKRSTAAHYIPEIDNLAREWKRLVEPHMQFLTPPPGPITEIVQVRTDPKIIELLTRIADGLGETKGKDKILEGLKKLLPE